MSDPLAPAVSRRQREGLPSGRPEPVNKIAAGLTMATAPPGVAGLAHQGKNFDYVIRRIENEKPLSRFDLYEQWLAKERRRSQLVVPCILATGSEN